MKPKPLVLLGMASLCGLVATISASRYLSEHQVAAAAAPGDPTQQVVVAAKRLDAGAVLTAESVKLMALPAANLPSGSFADATQLSGKVLRYPVAADEPILADKLSDDSLAGFTKRLRRGMRAFSVSVVDAASRIGGNIKLGDRVDVILVIDAGSEVEPTARTIMQNIEVLGVGRGSPAGPDEIDRGLRANEQNIILQVTQEQATELSLAQEKGRLKLSVRSHDDGETIDVPDASVRKLTGGSDRAGPAIEAPAIAAPAEPTPEPYTIKIVVGDKIETQTYERRPNRL
jgi:pilus assembly protein CpaB